MDKRYVENLSSGSFKRNFAKNLIKNKNKKSNVKHELKHIPSANFHHSNFVDLKEGMQVEHQIFGYGSIQKLDINSHQQKAIVNFKLVGEKTLLLSFAKLRIVG